MLVQLVTAHWGAAITPAFQKQCFFNKTAFVKSGREGKAFSGRSQTIIQMKLSAQENRWDRYKWTAMKAIQRK